MRQSNYPPPGVCGLVQLTRTEPIGRRGISGDNTGSSLNVSVRLVRFPLVGDLQQEKKTDTSTGHQPVASPPQSLFLFSVTLQTSSLLLNLLLLTQASIFYSILSLFWLEIRFSTSFSLGSHLDLQFQRHIGMYYKSQYREHREAPGLFQWTPKVEEADYNIYWALSPKVELRISPIQGGGLFAKRKIFAGELIWHDVRQVEPCT